MNEHLASAPNFTNMKGKYIRGRLQIFQNQKWQMSVWILIHPGHRIQGGYKSGRHFGLINTSE